MIGYKKFDPILHQRNDQKAKSCVRKFLEYYSYTVCENGQYDVDLAVYKNGGLCFFVEPEIKHGWKEIFPFETLHIPARKKKYLDLGKPVYFFVLNKDCTQIAIVPGSTMIKVVQKNTIYTQNESFFEIDKRHMIFCKVPKETNVI